MGANKVRSARKVWKRAMTEFEFHTKNRRRLSTIRSYECSIVEVVDNTPLGCVELHYGDGKGIGPDLILVTMLGDKKVAVPVLEGADHMCRLLGPEPICYGKWFPFSVLGGGAGQFVEGNKPGMIRKSPRAWKLRCFAPDGSLTWVPIPQCFEDADMPLLV